MLENVKRIFKQLNEEFPSWQELLEKETGFFARSEETFRTKILELILALRAYGRENDNDFSVFVGQVQKKETIDILRRYVNQTLMHYNACQPIREYSYEEKERTKDLIRDIFENYVLRYDSEIHMRCAQLSEVDEAKIDEVMVTLDTLTNYYVKKLMVQKDVAVDLQDETGLSKEVCEYYAQLYEEHFGELKINALMNDVENIQTYIRQMEE